jgi:SAM-dependent methyltransferase
MSDFWNQKYSTIDFIYGTEPNLYLKQQLLNLKPGKLLLPAEGEGRNAVFAAKLGWKVFAFDPSFEGQKKALKLASEFNVEIDYDLKTYQQANYAHNSFDVIGLTYTHLPANLRKTMHNNYIQWLKPKGTIILEAFSKEQLRYNSGGPKEESMLFSQEELRDDFKNLSSLEITKDESVLNEGPAHQGKASIIRMVGKK